MRRLPARRGEHLYQAAVPGRGAHQVQHRAGTALGGGLDLLDGIARPGIDDRQRAGGARRLALDRIDVNDHGTLAVASCARGGHIVVCGLMGGDITLSLPVIPMRPLTLQGSYVGTLEELRELVALVERTGMKAIPVVRRPLSDANAALQDLHAGRVVGRAILVP